MDFVFADFWSQYGNSLIMLLVQGILIAVMMEITIKKAFDSRIAKADTEEKIAKLADKKTKVCLHSLKKNQIYFCFFYLK